MYVISMLMVIAASIFYHVSQKSINQNASVGLSMIVTYGVALVLSILYYLVTDHKSLTFSEAFKDINWASYVLGIAVVLLEVGYLLVYRTGWEINMAAIFANVLTGIILVFVGFVLFSEKLTMVHGIGLVVSILGLVILKVK